jgi:hypothetical protein
LTEGALNVCCSIDGPDPGLTATNLLTAAAAIAVGVSCALVGGGKLLLPDEADAAAAALAAAAAATAFILSLIPGV